MRMSEKANIFSEIFLEDVKVLSHSSSVIEFLEQLVLNFHRPEILASASMSEEYQIH